MERRYEVEILSAGTRKLKNTVAILAHSKTQARQFARIIYRIDNRHSGSMIGKAIEYIYE